MTGLALAPTLITLFSLIEESVPKSRLNEAMGVVQTGMSGGIAPGAWIAGVVADGSGGSAAYWVCTVSAALAALASRRRRGEPAGLISGHGDMDQLVAAEHRPPAQEVSPHDAGEVVDAVVAARHQNLTVKMPGTGHSFTDIALTDGLLLRPGGPARHRRRRPGRDDRDRARRHDPR